MAWEHIFALCLNVGKGSLEKLKQLLFRECSVIKALALRWPWWEIQIIGGRGNLLVACLRKIERLGSRSRGSLGLSARSNFLSICPFCAADKIELNL